MVTLFNSSGRNENRFNSSENQIMNRLVEEMAMRVDITIVLYIVKFE